MRYFLFLIILFQWNWAIAAPNGCGSGWNVWVVPNSIPLLVCSFASCCNDHDTCYSHCEGRIDGECAYMRCKEGGDLYHSPRCTQDIRLVKSTVDAINRKHLCDNNFYIAMRSINRGKPPCEALAIVYRDAVKVWGDPSFNGMGNAETVPAWKQAKEQYDGALQEFFLKGTASQFEDFVRRTDERVRPTNLSLPLKFDQQRGLINIQGKP
ncbi:hypothetical protein JAB9_51360 [Janthinobacterium sp. HH107]|uniref:hypothetical protein n=1 Tax=Janthinobacterium TaxID=29580 RepID=UPI000892E237|nr:MULTISPECIES: hypothetical protein [Janthinobacterium]OEZ90941.1 hypothetical protein JAB9_51360 [Janthinobacterium sp. HH107]